MEPVALNNTIFLFYGEGGHKAEMELLLSSLFGLRKDINYIGLVEGKVVIDKIKNYHLVPMGNKRDWLIILPMWLFGSFYNAFKVLVLIIKHRPIGIISTGPGSVIFPAFFCWLLRTKIVYIENGSRFNTKSYTGRIMYFLAGKFYIQNAELINLYPKAIYAGMLS